MGDIAERKADHLDLCARGDVGFRATTTLFEDVRLVHDALPELELGEVSLELSLFGKRLSAPLIIAAMTGGTERARLINRDLAALAEAHGFGFGVGSQRAMLKREEARASYLVRDVAPSALVLGNLGVVQAAQASTSEVAGLVTALGADALCIHLNPAMELIQADGDRDFRGCLRAIERLVRELEVPVIVKETGCGLSRGVARRLFEAGVRHVDVSGAGGTSWVAVETERARSERRALGQTLREWGIPTAASVAASASVGFETVIATGGVATGLEVAKAIALGATAAGIARPVLQAHDRGGSQAAAEFLTGVTLELRSLLLLTGSRDVAALRRAPRVVVGELAEWLRQA